ncbi:MAG TPA: hypothetical protein VN213_15775 [Solirubrobacteraceae bacterium]|nr:hypothetical protein [Solirubrobacteraceae bacterium]
MHQAVVSTPIPLAHAFLALGDTAPEPPAPRRRGVAAAIGATLVLAFATPVSVPGFAAGDGDDHTPGTLPGKTWVFGADDDDAAGGG